MKHFAIWLVVVSATLVLGVAANAAFLKTDPAQDLKIRIKGYEQSAKATDSGVELAVDEAGFSGTGTYLTMTIRTTDRDSLSEKFGNTVLSNIRPAVDGFTSASIGGYTLEVAGRQDDKLMIILPPMVSSATYEGSIPLTFTALVAETSDGPVRIHGEWPITLVGPESSELKKILMVEEFAPSSVSIQDFSIAITGIRSTSETRIVANVPAKLLFLGQPKLIVDGSEPFLLSRSRTIFPTQVEWTFPPTPFGGSAALELGTLGVKSSGLDVAFTIDIRSALSRAGDLEAGQSFEFGPSEVKSDRPELLLSGSTGSYAGRPWVSVLVAGSWHLVEGYPLVLAGDGSALETAHVQTGYTKNANGDVSSGVTDIGFFRPERLDTVTILTGPSAVIADLPDTRIELRPIG